MRKNTDPTLNVVLALGVICVLAGFFLFTHIASNFNAEIHSWTVFCIFLGAIIFYLSLVTFKLSVLFFTGLFLCLNGCLFMILCSKIFPLGMKELWPLSIILCGFCLFLTGYARYRHVRSSYFYPSILIDVLGVFFLLFSLKVIKVSFLRFFQIFGPILLVILGIFLVIVFGIQQNPAFHFHYDEEEYETENDDPALSFNGEAEE